MHASKFRSWVPALLVTGIAALLGACTPNAPYHTSSGIKDNCRTSQTEPSCTNAYYQEHADYDLAFVEISDRGNVFSNRRLDDVLKRIGEKANQEGVVLITYVHGWKNNASEDNYNVKEFKRSLALLNKSLKGFPEELGERHLIGLYVGWRGKSYEFLQDANFLDFWDRKAVAEEVGKGAVTHLFVELDKITSSDEKNVMVVVGHSFGGSIVVSALNEVLIERTVNQTGSGGHPGTFADAVIVLNPAIEANQALTLVEAAMAVDDPGSRYPIFLSLSTDADIPTHYFFPIGRTLDLLLTWRQADLDRDYYYDRQRPEETLPLREEHLDTTTVGNFAPFLTHRFVRIERDETSHFEMRPCVEVPEACEPTGLTSLSGQPSIRDLPHDHPLYFIKTDASIMKNHSDIFNSEVRAFVFTFTEDVIKKKLENAARSAKSAPEVTTESHPMEQIEKFLDQLRKNYAEIKARETEESDSS